MAVRIFQFSVVFTIGFFIGPAAGQAVASGVTESSLSLHLKNPQDVTVVRGQAVTLRCEATSTVPGLNIFWLYNGSRIMINDSRKQLLRDGSLYIPKVAGKKLEGQYQCLANNSIGSVLSNPAKLTIASIDHEFIEHPRNISVTEFQPIVIPCQIQSKPNATIQWERDSKPLPHNIRYVPLPTGALLITSTHSSDVGIYRCVATNIILKKIKRSKFGQLTILPAVNSFQPVQILPLGIEPNQTVLVDNNVTLYCAVTGWPIPTIEWIKDNVRVMSINSTKLELTNVNLESQGNYTCYASNFKNQVSFNYQLRVHQVPYFNVTPLSVSFVTPRTLRLDCQAKGVPQPTISWFKNGKPLETVGLIRQQPSGLIFSHSVTTDQGIYQCVATNSAGRTWVSAQLVPSFSESRPKPPQNVQCREYSDNSICLTWDAPKNEMKIQAYSIYAFDSAGRRDFVTNYTSYLATGLKNSTNYTLSVRSYSKSASDLSDSVTCTTGISGSRNLEVKPLNETSVNLKWSKISNDSPCGSSKYHYKVQWKRVDKPSISVEYVTGFNKPISGLRPLSVYEFKVTSSINKNDDTSWTPFTLTQAKMTSEITSTTLTYQEVHNITSLFPIVPQQAEAQSLSPNSVNFTWVTPQDVDDISFTICYIEVQDEIPCDKGIIITSEANYIVVNNLKANTLYEFKVKSNDSVGISSAFSHSVQVQTFTDKPSSVPAMSFRVINSTTVCITWQPPVNKNGKITKYVVLYTSTPANPMENWEKIDVSMSQTLIRNCWPKEDAMSTILTELKPATHYSFTVQAETKAGLGKATTPVSFLTKDKAGGFLTTLRGSEEEIAYSGEDEDYNQKLGITLGLSISFLCILCCLSCIFFRKRCLKRQALRRARMAAASNHCTSNTPPTHPSTSIYLRHPETCAAEAHEMQQLVGEDFTHIPPITAIHLDTKGGPDFPNGQLNGTAKQPPVMNGFLSNGHVHITENPRYNHLDYNGFKNGKASLVNELKENNCTSDDDLSHLVLQPNKYSFTNGDYKKKNSEACRVSDYNSNCDKLLKDNSMIEDANVTQLTCLNDSFASLRRISPALGPNG